MKLGRGAPGEHHPPLTIPPPRLNRPTELRRQPDGVTLEGESGPTPAGKTFPHLNAKTRFRRERARDNTYMYTFCAETAAGDDVLPPPRLNRPTELRRQPDGVTLEGESGPTPAGKTFPHLHAKIRFRRERARDNTYMYTFCAETAAGDGVRPLYVSGCQL